MKLLFPFEISPRLVPALNVAGAWIALEYAANERTNEGRTPYRWTVDLPNGESFTGTDLQSGCTGGSLCEGFESLVSFLSAAGESFNYAERRGFDGMKGENSSLFPRPVTVWAAENCDELGVLAYELREREELITE